MASETDEWYMDQGFTEGQKMERERILAMLDKELAYLEDGDYWKEDEFLRISAKALRQFRGQITGEGQG